MRSEGAHARLGREQGEAPRVGANPDAARPPCSVVVIEDNIHMRQLLELRLARHDRLALARSFDTAEDVLLAVRDEGADVMLCDVGLRGMSGLEATPCSGRRAPMPSS